MEVQYKRIVHLPCTVCSVVVAAENTNAPPPTIKSETGGREAKLTDHTSNEHLPVLASSVSEMSERLSDTLSDYMDQRTVANARRQKEWTAVAMVTASSEVPITRTDLTCSATAFKGHPRVYG